MSGKILHLLSQRPGRTGSGITLEAFVNGAEQNGWQQQVIVGTPAQDAYPRVGELDSKQIHSLVFESDALPFRLPGMSDVMPYSSTVFSQMPDEDIKRYKEQWSRIILEKVDQFRPDLIHSHHIWLMSSLLKKLAPTIPVVTSCHATGLRQMKLCPHLRQEVIDGCKEIDRFFVLHDQHHEELQSTLAVESSRIEVIGAGYDQTIFHSEDRNLSSEFLDVAYAGKYSQAKGVPSLLDAIELLHPGMPDLRLHIAGTGSGPEADAIYQRMQNMAGRVEIHGQLNQAELADLFRRCKSFVLPSFYEGLPLVIVEAIACGCGVVCTDLPGVRNQILPVVGESIDLVSMPAMESVDRPRASELPGFSKRLAEALAKNLSRRDGAENSRDRAENSRDLAKNSKDRFQEFTWSGVFKKVEKVWKQLAH